MDFILINIEKCHCDLDACELSGDFAFAFSGGGIVPAQC